MDLYLTGKVALITGGSRGIGRATAFRLAEEGCAVAICARGAADVDRTLAELRERGITAHGVCADVTQGGEVERFVSEAATALGRVDLLVTNAGGSHEGRFLDSTDEDWRRTYELNVGHAARAVRSAVPYLAEAGGGAVVMIGSISGWKPAPYAQYGSAKAAEIYLAIELGRELAQHRIRVNAVSPGSILLAEGGDWRSYQERSPDRFAQFVERDLPAGRLGTAEEIADVVTFLLSDRASWINGAHICADGAQGRASASAW